MIYLDDEVECLSGEKFHGSVLLAGGCECSAARLHWGTHSATTHTAYIPTATLTPRYCSGPLQQNIVILKIRHIKNK